MKARLAEIVSNVENINFDKMKDALSRSAISSWAYILHDKDENTKPHYHIAIKLNGPYDYKYIAEWFGVSENFVNRVKGRWADMLKYLTHENAPNKYQYPSELVESNFDWEKEKAIESSASRLNQIIVDIVEGKIRKYNYHEHINPVEFNKYYRSIERTFLYRTELMKGVHRNMEAVFVTGDSGSGKTTFAKLLAEEKKMSIYVSSGSNDVLDDYQGQDCIILDDLRPSTIGLSDLLKMLDNHTASTVKSRYRNKVLECKLIVITTVLDIDTFFYKVFSEQAETINQLKRRCQTLIKMDKSNYHVYVYDDHTKVYDYVTSYPNPALMYNKKPLTSEEKLQIASRYRIGVNKSFDYLENKIKELNDDAVVPDENVKLPFD